MMTECSHHLDQSNDNTHSLRCMYITQTINILHVVNLTIIISKSIKGTDQAAQAGLHIFV